MEIGNAWKQFFGFYPRRNKMHRMEIQFVCLCGSRMLTKSQFHRHPEETRAHPLPPRRNVPKVATKNSLEINEEKHI